MRTSSWIRSNTNPSGGDLHCPRGTALALEANSVGSKQIKRNAVKAKQIDPKQVQRRVGEACPAGQAIREVQQKGQVKCAGVGGSGEPTGAAGGALTGSYPSPHIATGAVDTARLAGNVVTNAKLRPNAVTAAKIADNAAGVRAVSLLADARDRRYLAAIGLLVLALVACGPAEARAGQQGGSILYEDPVAVGQRLEFRAYVWRTLDGSYWKSTGRYREVGASAWKGLENKWGWTRRQALRDQVIAARFLAADGYLWRFADPRRAPGRAERFRFEEKCWATGSCVASLLSGKG